MVRIGRMASPKFPISRRELMAGLGTVTFGQALPAAGLAQGRASLPLHVKAGSLALRTGGPATPIWELTGSDLRRKRGEIIDIAFRNDLPVPATLAWRGLDGGPTAEPLLARGPLATGRTDTLQIALRHAGTFFCDPGLLGDAQVQPVRGMPLIVSESQPIGV